MKLNTIEELIDDIRHGKMIILMDDEDRENEGDIIMAASMVRAEDINFMAKHARGLICLTLTKERCQQLNLPLMVDKNDAQHGTNFTVSIEAAEGVTTGISAADRALTVRTAVQPNARPGDIVQPGHIFPLMAKPGGVLTRAGHTEAGCDLARLAGLEPAAAIVEIMNEDGTMARRPDLEKFAEQHNLKIGTIADLIHYRTINEKTIEKVMQRPLPTEFGEFVLSVYRDTVDQQIHLALSQGDIQPGDNPVVRVHQVDAFRDIFSATLNGRIGWSIRKSMECVAKEGAGVVVVLGQSFNATDISNRIESYFNPQKRLYPTTEGGIGIYRTIGTGSQILRDLGVTKMRLLSSPMRFNALSGFDLEITEYLEASD